MTNDEIKQALRERCPVIHHERTHQTAITYAYAQAWRVTVDEHGQFVSSLELVTFGRIKSIVIARAEECELMEGAKQ